MFHRHLSLVAGRALTTAATLGWAMTPIASIALPQTMPGGRSPESAAPALLHHVAADGTRGAPSSFADLVEKVEPAVVAVVSKGKLARKPQLNQPFGPDMPDQDDQDQESPGAGVPEEGKPPQGHQMITIGSGFFISADGYAITNNHVVEDSDSVDIRTNDQKAYSARVVGKDAVSDLALIKVDGREDFSYVKFADQAPRVGDWVLTAGNPFGLGNSVTAGIVSARQRNIQADAAEDLVQIDAPINKGDSGGPTFNTQGEVVGVNSMIFSPSGGSVGVAFAVPAETVKSVVPQLKDKGRVTRGWIGAEVQSITPGLAESLGDNNLHGAIIASVKSNGPAAHAGLRTGDTITSVGGAPVKDANELTKKIHGMRPGSSVQFGTFRKGSGGSVNVTLGELPAQTANPAGPGK